MGAARLVWMGGGASVECVERGRRAWPQAELGKNWHVKLAGGLYFSICGS